MGEKERERERLSIYHYKKHLSHSSYLTSPTCKNSDVVNIPILTLKMFNSHNFHPSRISDLGRFRITFS